MKIYFLILAFVLSIFVLNINAQSNSEQKQSFEFPIVPFILEYEYAPYFISQNFKDHPHYSFIEAILNPSDASSVEVILTEKETKRRVFYSNSEAKVKLRTLQGRETILSKIDFKRTETDKGLAIFGFGFRDKNGTAILWRVLPTSTPSERGAGLTPMSGAADFRLEYRDIGTTVGEGTALKIGNQTFEAIVQPERSAPPYFYSFDGSFTVGRHIGSLRLGMENWKVISQPKHLKKDGEWILVNEKGYRRTLRIISDYNDELVIDEANPQIAGASLIKVVVHLSPQGYHLRAVEARSGSREMRIKFEPQLPLHSLKPSKFEGAFTVSQGENKNISSGAIIAEQSGGNLSLKWLLKSPDWAKIKSMETLVKIEPQGYSIETKSKSINK